MKILKAEVAFYHNSQKLLLQIMLKIFQKLIGSPGYQKITGHPEKI